MTDVFGIHGSSKTFDANGAPVFGAPPPGGGPPPGAPGAPPGAPPGAHQEEHQEEHQEHHRQEEHHHQEEHRHQQEHHHLQGMVMEEEVMAAHQCLTYLEMTEEAEEKMEHHQRNSYQ